MILLIYFINNLICPKMSDALMMLGHLWEVSAVKEKKKNFTWTDVTYEYFVDVMIEQINIEDNRFALERMEGD